MSEGMVSVIVPVYNAGSWIEDTVLSVRSQSYTDWELILVDDKSTDNSLELMEYLKDKKVKVIASEENKGASYARNRGVKEASGRYICFIDADDLWSNDKLEKQLKFMEEHDAAFSFTGYEFADESGVGVQKIVRVPATITYRQALKNTTIFTSTVMFDMEKLGKDDIMMPHVPSEDTATWWKVLKKVHKAYGLDEALTLYRRSGNTLSSNKMTAIQRIWNLYRNVEKLNPIYSAYCFVFWAVRALLRRL